MLSADELANVRQVGVVDARGRVAVHTGADCIPEAGHATGEHWTCQANMMARATVPDAMSAAFQRAYELAGEADETMAAGDAHRAAELYVRASELAPQSDELLFWAGLAIAHEGDVEAGTDAVRRAAEVHPGWLTLLDRLTPDFAPAGEAVRAKLSG